MKNNLLEKDILKQQIAESFNRRTNYDKESNFHPRLADSLIEYAQVKPGQKILDLATGTGLVAIKAARKVDSQGWVIGVDISPGMLVQANKKIAAASLNNIEMWEADVETVEFPENTFDQILCCSALPFITDIPAALRRWRRFLKPGGKIGLCVFAETAFITAVLLNKVAKKHDIVLPIWNQPTGNQKKCFNLLKNAGFKNIQVNSEQFGSYLSLTDAKKTWHRSLRLRLYHQLQQQKSNKLAEIKSNFFLELEALVTDRGIWNDILTFFVFGHK